MKITNWGKEICQKNYEKNFFKKLIFVKKSISIKFSNFFVKFIAVIISLYENVIRGG